MEVKEINVKSILTKSKLPDTDYVINPYVGCRFGCIYCYASFMGRFVNKEIKDWGNYVHVKINAPELLTKELSTLKKSLAKAQKDPTQKVGDKKIKILLSSVTDPYQGLESKYQLTRKCIEILANQENQFFSLSILTKSPLVLRDVDILSRIKDVEVGLTITSTKDNISRYFEKYAPNVTDRLKALDELNKKKIKTYAFVGPLFPYFATKKEILDEIFSKIAQTGTKEIYIEHINLSPYILGRFLSEAKEISAKDKQMLKDTQKKEYRNQIDQEIKVLVNKYNLKIRLEDPIYHNEKS